MSLDSKHKLVPVAKELCRDLRKRQTKAEEIFWNEVRNRKFLGLKFYRQFPIFIDANCRETFFIADFYCHEKRIVVEIDGRIHDYRKDHDELREELICSEGIQMIRFKNDDVENDACRVIAALESFVVSSVQRTQAP